MGFHGLAVTAMAALCLSAPIPVSAHEGTEPDERRTIDLFQRLAPATVFLSVTYDSTHPLLSPSVTGVGAGFVVDESGTVLTNSHVVEGAQMVTATFYDGRRVSAALVGLDPTSDVAVLQLAAERPAIVPILLGDSDALRIGQQTMVVGSPFGLGFTLTTGIISGVGPPQGMTPFAPSRLIQTTAPLNPGNSGGPLVDSQGQVVGIATATLMGAQNIGFAIPINVAKQVLAELKEKGRVVRPWLGVGGKFVTEDLRRLLTLPLTTGLLVEDIEDGSPAGEAGIRTGQLNMTIEGVPWVLGGDIVVALHGQPIPTPEAFAQVSSQLQVGQEVQVEVMREGQRLMRSVVLSERPVTSGRRPHQSRQQMSEAVPRGLMRAIDAQLSSF
jgi:S1-C subfamily serine protease